MQPVENIDYEEILNAVPGDQKPQGTAKLGEVIAALGKVIKTRLTKAVIVLIGEVFEKATGINTEGGIIDLSDYIPQEHGPLKIDLQDFINKTIPEPTQQKIDLLKSGDIKFNTVKLILKNPVVILSIVTILKKKITKYEISNTGNITITPTLSVNVVDIIDGQTPNLPIQIKNELTPIVEETVKEQIQGFLCSASIKQIIAKRNVIVETLNNIGGKLNVITSSITNLSNFYQLVLTTLIGIDAVKSATSLATKLLPITPGAAGSLLSDLQDIKHKLLFTETGTSRLDKVKASISTASIYISMVAAYILTIVSLLGILDFILIKLCPESTNDLFPISDTNKQTAALQAQAAQSDNQTTYEGFNIEIEVVPYTPTVDRRRAIGKNQYGITMIQTELSFTTNDQTLINELKFIIDRDNLKAY